MINDLRAVATPPHGMKHDSGKQRWDLLPSIGVSETVDVLTSGAMKYDANNWQLVANPRDRYYAAAMRHLQAWWQGEKRDSESGHHHLAHAICNLLFLHWFDTRTKE